MTPRDDDPTDVYRITAVAPSRSRDLDRRVNRYLISMAIRTACVILVFVVPGPARWVFGLGAVFLPYVAVLFANASGARPERGPAPVDRHGLQGSAGPDPAPAAPTAPPVARSSGAPTRPADPADPPGQGRPDAPQILLGHVISSSARRLPDDR